MNALLAAAVGGVITSIAIPFTSYITIRFVNHRQTKVRIEPKIDNRDHRYETLNMRIVNNSWTTLKNVICYITVRYSPSSIRVDPNVRTYSVETSDKPLMLSWAKVVSDGNLPEININQREEPDLNLFRYHYNFDLAGRGLWQIASEQGFSDGTRKGRVLLHLENDLPFKIMVTAENMSPILKSYVLKIDSREIVEA